MTNVLTVYRAPRFSPNSVGRDKAIIDAVAGVLAAGGCGVTAVSEEELADCYGADVVLTMARTQRALRLLEAAEAAGCMVVNASRGVRACSRSNVDRLMRAFNLPAAPLDGGCGYWLKRGDEAAQSHDDVVFAPDADARDKALARFTARGVADVVVTAHVEGDLVKFYGVVETGFFRTFYPADEGFSKFGDEALNGSPCRYQFSVNALAADATRLAVLLGVDVYGGDAIVRKDGTYAIIDFNDWPSFSRCRQEAAEAIACLVTNRLKTKEGRAAKAAAPLYNL